MTFFAIIVVEGPLLLACEKEGGVGGVWGGVVVVVFFGGADWGERSSLASNGVCSCLLSVYQLSFSSTSSEEQKQREQSTHYYSIVRNARNAVEYNGAKTGGGNQGIENKLLHTTHTYAATYVQTYIRHQHP
jgi:hypothetical protein